MEIIRYENNPIIEPRGDDWEACATFNPAAIYDNGKIHILYRAVGDYLRYSSKLGYAIFDEDLKLIERYEQPVFTPEIDLWEFSIEDPRLSFIGDRIFLTYVVTPTPFCPGPVRIRLGIPKPKQAYACTAYAYGDSILKLERRGVITPFGTGDRDTMFFPEKIRNKFAVLHRPANWIGAEYKTKSPGIWFAFFNDSYRYLYDHRLIMSPKEDWELKKIGAGSPPVLTEYGWLLLYHGVDNNSIYRVGAALLDKEYPWKVLARTPEPLMEPEEDYELHGDVPNVVFPEGSFIIGDKLIVIYGAADKVVCAASIKTNSLIDYLLSINQKD